MSESVVFCQLSRKFVDENDNTPSDAQQVVYYSLAIGHHLGVIDCLKENLVCSFEPYKAWIATLEAGSEARRKMEGVPRYGEIVIDQSHVVLLAKAFDAAIPTQTEQQQIWSQELLDMLQAIQLEPAIYLMVRRRYDLDQNNSSYSKPATEQVPESIDTYATGASEGSQRGCGSKNEGRHVLLCVGNTMMGDDGAGPLLAEKCLAAPQGDWVVIDGGTAPENDVVAIRELRPARLLLVDATDMGLAPGEIRVIDPDDIAEMFMMTTHNMPLNYLIDQLKEDVGEVIFLGIQPDIVGFYYPMTDAIKAAVETVYQRLACWEGKGGFADLEAPEFE